MENSIIHSKYKKIKKLGQGALGAAYEVSDINDNQKYVIKEIQMKVASKQEIDELVKEANILSTINNENVVKYYE